MGLERLRQARIDKLQRLRNNGINPYPYRFQRTHFSGEILDRFQKFSPDEEVAIAGRVMLIRRHGRAGFAHLMDSMGRIQFYIRSDEVGEEMYELYRLLEIGDIIGVRGRVFKTKTGEVTVWVKELEVLAKALRPLPDKWQGLRDIELRYRRRYIDLLMNPSVRQTFLIRSRIIQILRQVLDHLGFVEVETPALQPIYGGASARPFVTHHHVLETDLYLRIADELYLKRLIVGGFDRVYEMCKDFRNEGMDRSHNPEFTMLELYQAYADYNDMMEIAQRLMVAVSDEIEKKRSIVYQEQTIDLSPPWPRRPMLDLLKEYADIDLNSVDDDGLKACYARMLPDRDEVGKLSRGKLIDHLFEQFVQPHLIQPTFVIDHPKELSPLAKEHRSDPRLTERFELFIGGQEIANAFSELNDPLEQRKRFEAQVNLIAAGDDEAQRLDEDFLRALEHGMPPSGGLGIGVDRVVMVFTDSPSIQDVILFPQMRHEDTIRREQ